MLGFLYNNFACEVILFALFLICIMLYNRFTLYRADFSAPLTRMLFAGAGYCIAELLWLIFIDNEAGPSVSVYFTYIAYSIASLAVSIYFFALIVDGLFGWPKSHRMSGFITLLPFLINGLVFLIFISGVFGPITEKTEAIDTYNHILMASVCFFLTAGIIISVIVLLKNRKKDTELHQKAMDYLSYGIIGIFILALQMLIFDAKNWFLSIGMSCALCYLTIRQSTNTLVKEASKRSAMEAELDTAAKIQLSALPKNSIAFAHHNEIALHAAMYPAKEVGGDFYDYFELGDRRVCFLMADVSGKGIPAAMFMMRAKTIIKDLSAYCENTAEIFDRANAALCEDNTEGMFATAWIGILDTETLLLQFTNAGHNYPYISQHGGKFGALKSKHGPFLGFLPTVHYKQTEIQLEVGDRLFLYTDGLTEAHNKAEELYSDERLGETLNRMENENGEEFLFELKASADDFSAGAPQFDDITMLIINVEGENISRS